MIIAKTVPVLFRNENLMNWYTEMKINASEKKKILLKVILSKITADWISVWGIKKKLDFLKKKRLKKKNDGEER